MRLSLSFDLLGRFEMDTVAAAIMMTMLIFQSVHIEMHLKRNIFIENLMIWKANKTFHFALVI